MVEGPDDYRGGGVDGITWAAFDVSHSAGDRSIVGGFVYRGNAIPELRGWYVFTDTYSGNLRALRRADDGLVELREIAAERNQAVAFAEGPDGELYVMSFEEGVGQLVPAGAEG